MKITALIMAGGRGERFWPKSRVSLPKQFLNIIDENRTMIQLTIERIRPLVKPEDVFILTNSLYSSLTKEQVCNTEYAVPEENIIFEPCAKNTAPAIALGAAHIQKKYGDSILLVLPSDSMILHNDRFVDVLKKAIKAAEVDENIVTVGITPDKIETGYGYIHYEKETALGMPEGICRVKRYVEKPDYKTAEAYLASGEYLWNSGQFIMKCSTILHALKKYSPDVAKPVKCIGDSIGTNVYKEVLQKEFSSCPSISIDYAVMEKSDSVFTVEGTFGWNDVGSWNALDQVKPLDSNCNSLSANTIVLDCNNCIIEGKEKLIAAIGLEDLIVVDTDDVLFLCKRDQAQNIKKVLQILRDENKDQYL